MRRFHLSSLSTRIKNSLVALLFVGTQVAFPLALSGVATAAGGNPAATLQQCRNGSLASPAQCIDSGGSLGWVSGNAGASDSHWREGDSLAYRMLFSNLATSGSHAVTIQWDTTKSGTHALDYLTTYNRTESTANPCSGVSGCSGLPSTFAIPTDTQVSGAGVSQVPGVFSLWGGVITGVGSYSYPDGSGFSGDKTAQLTITFTATTDNPVLSWAGHIASQVDWGVGHSAPSINGSSYHTRLIDLDGSGGNQDRSMSASAVFPTPTITTQVSSSTVTVGNTVTDTATLVGPGNNPPAVTGSVKFFVCGPSGSVPDCTTGGTQVGSAVTIVTGHATSSSYSVTSAGNYCFRAEYTPDATAPYSPQNHTNTTTECFTASIAPSTITIIKDAVPNDTQDFHFTTSGGLSTDTNGFSLDDDSGVVGADNTLSNTQTFTNVAPGVYTVTEGTEPSGWDFTSLNCGASTAVNVTGQTATITITGGQSVTCTFTNTKRGHLIVQKTTVPSGDQTNFSINTTSSTGGTVTGGGAGTISDATDQNYEVTPGTYSVTETVPSGWSKTGDTCQNVAVAAGATVYCTITNTKLAKLNIIKATAPSSSSQSFNFGTTGPSITQANGSFVLDTNSSDNTYPSNNQYSNLTPGTYTVTETEPSGWQLTGLTCNGITYTWPGNTQTLSLDLPAGADVNCTFTNTQLVSISGTKYEANANSSTVGPLQNWTIYLLVNGQTINQTTTDSNGNFSFNNLFPGSYTLTEQLQSGWTQIFSPSGINLTAGQTSTGNNFGNFQNASISGSKFNDQNGNHAWDQGEPGLSGWTITLYDNGGSGALLNHQVAQTATANNGSYSFTNLPPTDYKVCETAQAGWTQTFPTTNGGCQLITVSLSGHNYSGTNFGNQGRGTITVVKNVNDGFGNVTQDVTTWTWGYTGTFGSSGSDIVATGSTNHQNVAAGSYTVTENQKTDYHVTASSCTGEVSTAVNTSKSVTVSPGEDVVCTFTNTRDTGNVRVNKTIVNEAVGAANDGGLFDLHVNGTTSYTATDQADGGTTGDVKVVTGTYTTSETAGTGTNLADYSSTWTCDNETSGNGTTTDSFSVGTNDSVTCTFTNTRLASLTIVKDANPDSSQSFDFHFGVNQINNIEELLTANNTTDFSLTDDGSSNNNSKQFTRLTPGTTYYVNEDTVAGWDLTGISCGRGVEFGRDGSKITITMAAGENVTCTYTNTERGSITIVKDAQPDSTQSFSFTGDLGQFNLKDDGLNDGLNSQTFDNLIPGTYNVSELSAKGWTLADIHCDYEGDAVGNTNTNGVNIGLEPGDNVTCTFTNTRDTGTITVNKVILPSTDTGLFNLSINGETSFTATDQSNGGTTGHQQVNTGSYTVNETAGTNTNLADYSSTWSCTSGDEETSSGTGTEIPSFDVGAGDNVVCTFTNTRLATLTVVKDAQPNSTQSFGFQFGTNQVTNVDELVTINDVTNFNLVDDGTNTQNSKVFVHLIPGKTYFVDESTLPAGWNLTNIDCGNGVQFTRTGTKITITLAAGDTITCTYTNTHTPGQVLGASIVLPTLVNTGEAALTGWFVGISLLMAVAALTAVNRRHDTE